MTRPERVTMNNKQHERGKLAEEDDPLVLDRRGLQFRKRYGFLGMHICIEKMTAGDAEIAMFTQGEER